MRTYIVRIIFSFIVLVLSNAALADEININAQKGRVLHDKLCISCHVGMFAGDGSGIYTRIDRKVNSLQGLRGQIGNCNHNLGLKLTEQQLTTILDYLSQTYYKFDK